MTLTLKAESGRVICYVVRSLTLRPERESGGGGGEAGKGVCLSVYECGEDRKGWRREEVTERSERRTKEPRLRGGRAGRREGTRKEGMMSERIASCGSLYDSTNLLLQYCNNGEPLHLAAQCRQLTALSAHSVSAKEKCRRAFAFISECVAWDVFREMHIIDP